MVVGIEPRASSVLRQALCRWATSQPVSVFSLKSQNHFEVGIIANPIALTRKEFMVGKQLMQ